MYYLFQLQSASSTVHLCDKKKTELYPNTSVNHGSQEVKKNMLINSKCEKNMKNQSILLFYKWEAKVQEDFRIC